MTTVASVSGSSGEIELRGQWPAADEPDRLEQRHGRDDRRDGGGHQDHGGEQGGLDEVRAAHHARRDARRPEPGHLGSPAPELAGEPGEQVGQRDQPDADRHQHGERVGAGLTASRPAGPRPRRTSRACRRRPCAAGRSRRLGCRHARSRRTLALATVPTDPRSTRPRSSSEPGAADERHAATTPTTSPRGPCRRCPGRRWRIQPARGERGGGVLSRRPRSARAARPTAACDVEPRSWVSPADTEERSKGRAGDRSTDSTAQPTVARREATGDGAGVVDRHVGDLG